MTATLRSWRQKVKKHPVATVLITVAIALVTVVLLGGYKFNWNWTGFTGSNKSGKALWDWMQLLFIPVVLAVAGFWFNHRERKAAELRAENERKAAEYRAWNERKAAELRAEAEREIEQRRAEADREISLDNQREVALKEYIDAMSELLLHENLRKSEPDDEVRNIARLRTLTVLDRLDSKRKGHLLKFLDDSGLISDGDTPVISLFGANLRGANLRQAYLGYFPSIEDYETVEPANLRGADLSETDLNGAGLELINLQYANLTRANLSSADLSRARMRRADLTEADLRKATLMEADLRNANLTGANLTNARLSLGDVGDDKNPFGADLSNANLTSVIGITAEELEKNTTSLKGATMPDGSIHS